jgi:hypothetical protein
MLLGFQKKLSGGGLAFVQLNMGAFLICPFLYMQDANVGMIIFI